MVKRRPGGGRKLRRRSRANPGTTLLPCPAFGDDVLPAPILHAFRDGKQAKVPLIIGGNSYEASVAEAFNIPPALLVKALMDNPLTSPLIDSLEYTDLNIVDLGRKFVRDVMFLAFERRLAEAHATHGVPVWRYYFTYVPEGCGSFGTTPIREISAC